MLENFTYDVFLSHASQDKEEVRRLATDLQSHDLKVWLDEWQILVGDSITQKLEQGLLECRYLGLWITNAAMKSGWVEREWRSRYHEEVKSRSVQVLPMLRENCELPVFLVDKKYADFRNSYNQGLHELLAVFSRGNLLHHDPSLKATTRTQTSSDVVVATVRQIKENTKFLWPELTELRQHRRACSAELLESTMEKIGASLECLRDNGHLLFSVCPDGVAKTGEPVVRIEIQNVSDQLLNLVQLVHSEHRAT